MQEEIENRTVNLAISTTRLSFRTLISAGRAYMNHRYRVNAAKKNGKEERPEGKQCQISDPNRSCTGFDFRKAGR